MNGHEHVLMSLKHQEPDRVPFDLGGTLVTVTPENLSTNNPQKKE
jgi:hypothetical protein